VRLRAYLQLPVDNQGGFYREALDAEWVHRDAGFAERLAVFPGVRIIALPLFEALVSFLGSANNNIKRNTQMLQNLAAEFPENQLGVLHGQPFYGFPTLEQVSHLSAQRLGELGWGYRAPRLEAMARQLKERGGLSWLLSLGALPHEEAQQSLAKLSGVGRKVADCVLLFSELKFSGAIPVDTHCWQFMLRSYLPDLKGSPTSSAAQYRLIGDTLRDLFGRHAGWAFMVLFVAEVHPFRLALKLGTKFDDLAMWFGSTSDHKKLVAQRTTKKDLRKESPYFAMQSSSAAQHPTSSLSIS